MVASGQTVAFATKQEQGAGKERKQVMKVGKNKNLINQCKIIYKHINNITPQVYACIALAMHRSGKTFEEISDLFALSQEVWAECVNSDINMIEMCEQETGIDVQRQVEG